MAKWAVNGIAQDGSLITTNEQVQEVWTGTTLGLAALMLSDGMERKAMTPLGASITSVMKPKAIGSVLRKLGTSRVTSAHPCNASRCNLGHGDDRSAGSEIARQKEACDDACPVSGAILDACSADSRKSRRGCRCHASC